MLFRDMALARRLEDAETASTLDYVAARARVWPRTASAAMAVGDGWAVYVGQDSPINRIYGLGLHAAVTAEQLTAGERFLGERATAARLDLCPLADPSLARLLLSRAYAIEMFKHVWWRTLTPNENSRNVAGRPHPPIRVEIVEPAQFLLWAQVVSSGFSGAANLAAADVTIPLTNAHKAATRCFIAWLNDVPAGGAALAIHEGVAICFSTSTRSAFRRLGVQRALLAARLAYARQHGCDLAAVSTVPGSASQRNVERIGFSLAYTKPTLLQTASSGRSAQAG